MQASISQQSHIMQNAYTAHWRHRLSLVSASTKALTAVHDIVESPLQYAGWQGSLDECASAATRLNRESGRTRSGAARIVVVGRTKAGKSTLRYVLTGDGEDGIGTGGQRTTRQVIEYRWRDLVVVDTPGVGGVGTDEDTKVALDAADDADLVLWVTTSDGVQLATEGPVLRAALGRPVLVLVNHKSTFTTEEITHGLSDDVVRTDEPGLEARIRGRLSVMGIADPQIVHTHLGLARRARYQLNDDLLAEQSGISDVESALHAAAQDAVALRPITSARRLAVDAEAFVEALQAASSVIDAHKRHLRTQHHGLAAAVRRSRTRHDDIWRTAIESGSENATAALDAALSAATKEPHRGKAQLALRSDVEMICANLAEVLRSAGDAARDEVLRQIPPTLQPGQRGSAEGQAYASLNSGATSIEGDPQVGLAVDRVLKVGVAGLAAAAVFATDGLAALVIGPVTGLLGDVGRRLVKPFLPNADQEQAKRVVSVDGIRTEILGALAAWRADALTDMAASGQHLTGVAAARVNELSDRIERYSTWVAILRRRAVELSAAADSLRQEGMS